MKDWWLNLSYREKQTTSLGAFVVVIFLIYALIWSPLSNGVNTLREKIRSNQSLLSFMQESDKRIQALKQNNVVSRSSTISLLNLVQTDINNTSLARGITQLQEMENDTVSLRLQKVSFDSLMKWLTVLCRDQLLTISQMSVTPSADPGIVNVDLKLQSQSH